MCFRRETCQQLRFDAGLTGYALGEDVDFSYRVSKLREVVINPLASVIHLRSASTSRPNGDWLLCEIKFYSYMFHKNWNTSLKNRCCFLWMKMGFFFELSRQSALSVSPAPLRHWKAAFENQKPA